MRVLGIETSCDETAVAVVEAGPEDRPVGRILANVVYSQLTEHRRFGGVVPEIAARAHLERIDGLVEQALAEAKLGLGDLDGIAAARQANGNSGLPHTLTHEQFVRPEDFPRFRALGVISALQLFWAEASNDTIEIVKPYLDPTVYKWQYPARSILDNGGIISGASDWPVSTANVFRGIYQAETRKGAEGILDASQDMPREAMFYAYTRNSAHAMNMQDSIGSIAPGKSADMILLDRDVLTISPEKMRGTKVLWTMVAGKVVYRAK